MVFGAFPTGPMVFVEPPTGDVFYSSYFLSFFYSRSLKPLWVLYGSKLIEKLNGYGSVPDCSYGFCRAPDWTCALFLLFAFLFYVPLLKPL